MYLYVHSKEKSHAVMKVSRLSWTVCVILISFKKIGKIIKKKSKNAHILRMQMFLLI